MEYRCWRDALPPLGAGRIQTCDRRASRQPFLEFGVCREAKLGDAQTGDLDRLHKPSSSTVDGVNAGAASQLEKWKHRLSGKQIDDILRIVDESGLSCIYSYATEPDYSAVSRFQDTRHCWPSSSQAGGG